MQRQAFPKCIFVRLEQRQQCLLQGLQQGRVTGNANNGLVLLGLALGLRCEGKDGWDKVFEESPKWVLASRMIKEEPLIIGSNLIYGVPFDLCSKEREEGLGLNALKNNFFYFIS